MDGSLLGICMAALSAILAAYITARSLRSSTEQSTVATEAASEREFQLAFLKTLQEEIAKLNTLRNELRAELAQTHDDLDAERSHRRALEFKLDELTETVERLQSVLKLIPGLLENVDVQRFIQRDFGP